MKELTSRQQQALATKNRIRSAAYDLLIHENYESLTMQKIADAANVSVGTLYHYYASKEELFFTSYSGFDDLIHEMQDEVHFDSALEAIRSILYASAVSSFFLNPTLIASILSIQLSTHSKLFSDNERYFPKYVYEQVKRALDTGELLPLDDAQTITQTLLRSSRGSIFDCAVRNAPEDIVEIAIHDLNVVLSHYRPNHNTDFPSVNLIWLELNRKRYSATALEK